MDFWKNFISEVPENMTICLENVLENRPQLLLDIVRQVNDPGWVCAWMWGTPMSIPVRR